MRQLINSTYITLDGVVEGPHLWPPLKAGTSGEGDRIQTDLLEACDIVLMGRRTYDVFAPAWSARSGDAYSDWINTMRKVVASTTLGSSDWHDTTVVTDLLPAVRDLKAEDGGPILIPGSRSVVQALLAAGLVDEVHLQVFPIVLGSGRRLWAETPDTLALSLVSSVALEGGVQLQTWRPAESRAVDIEQLEEMSRNA